MKNTDSSLEVQGAKAWLPTALLRFCSAAVLLLTGLYGTLLCFFNTFSLPESQTALLWALPTALLFLLIFALPKYRGIAYLVVFILWGIASFFVMRQVVAGAVFVAEQFSTQASSVFTKLGHFTPPQAQEELAACRMFFRVVQFPLTGYLAWAVVKAHSFFFSLLATAPFLAIAAVVGLVPPAFALVLLIGFWAAMLLSGRAGKAGEKQAAQAGLLLSPFAFLLTILVVLFCPPDAYQPSASVVQARNAVIQKVSQLLDTNRNDAPAHSSLGVPMTGSPGSTDLTNAGELSFTGQTALRVSMAQPQDLYLRGWAGAVYTGTSWDMLSEADYRAVEADFQPLLYASVSRKGLSGRDETMELSSIDVETVSANRSYVYLPYQLAQVENILSSGNPNPQIASDFVQDAYLKPEMQSGSVSPHYKLSFYSPLSETLQRQISSQVKQRERAYEAHITKEYTQLPNGVRERLLAYAEAAGLQAANGPEDWLRVAQAVAGTVASAGTYTEKPGTMPAGKDFVTYFLEERPQGYCIHFASAAAALMRALDVPARYVEGYTVKTSNFKKDGNAEIPDRQAHAWVEIWVDGVGWMPIEATPGGAATLRENPDSDKEPPEGTALPTQTPTSDGSVTQTGLKTSHWLLPLLLCLFLTAPIAVRLELTRRRKLAFRQENRNQAAIAVYAYLCRLTRFGYSISGEAQRIARKAKFSRHTLTREELAALQKEAEQGEKSTYAGLPPWKKLLFRILVF